MRGWIPLGAAASAGALVAALWLYRSSLTTSKHARPGATDLAPAAPRHVARQRAAPDSSADIDRLLADASPAAWGRLASLYPGSDEPTKRRVLAGLERIRELDRVTQYLLATVGEDPTPSEVDPLVDEAAQLLVHRLKTSDDVEATRRAMVMQQTDKRRWVLARTLLVLFESAGATSPFLPLKSAFEAKLIDLHAAVDDAFVKTSLIDGVRSLGGKDAALILEKGLAVRDEELEALNDRRSAAERVLEQQRAP